MKYLFFIIFSFCSQHGFSQNCFNEGAFEFCISDNDTTSVKLTKIAKDYNLMSSPHYGNLTIPYDAHHNGHTYHVTEIASEAFAHRFDIVHVTISNGITTINNNAFTGCINLKAISLPQSIRTIYGNPLTYCPSLELIEIDPDNTEYASPDGSNAIVDVANKCLITGCYTTTIPNCVKSIKADAFSGQEKLTKFCLPEQIVTITGNPFGGCNNLSEIKVDKRNPVFDSRSKCNAIINTESKLVIAGCASTRIPRSVKGIEFGAFLYLDNLNSIYIPRNISTISPGAFYGCKYVSRIDVSPHNKTYDSRNGCNAVLNTGTNELIVGCRQTTIPETAEAIGDYAFAYRLARPALSLPQSIKRIGKGAFLGCDNLKYVYVPENATFIGRDAFAYCHSLSEVYIFGNIETISHSTFYDCTRLTTVFIPDCVKHIDYNAFGGCVNLKQINTPKMLERVADNAFDECRADTKP